MVNVRIVRAIVFRVPAYDSLAARRLARVTSDSVQSVSLNLSPAARGLAGVTSDSVQSVSLCVSSSQGVGWSDF